MRAIALTKATWNYRGFILGSVRREFEARYTRSLLGNAWAVLNPITMIVIYSVVFSQIMRSRIEGIDNSLAYTIYLCAGLFTWSLFSDTTNRLQNIFIDRGDLIKKLNFPRICLPIIVALSEWLNFAIVLSLFLLFLIFTGNFPGLIVAAVLPVLVLQTIFALGLGVTLGVFNVFFRDVGQFFIVAVQLWFWLTPIVYPATILPDRALAVLRFNPMMAIIGAYQDVFVRGVAPDWYSLIWPALLSIFFVFLGSYLFRAYSASIADEL